MLTTIFLISWLMAIINMVRGDNFYKNQKWLAKIAPKIDMESQSNSSLEGKERNWYHEGLRMWALGEKEGLNNWIENMVRHKKFGILPEMPRGYKHPAVIKVEGSSILIDRAEK